MSADEAAVEAVRDVVRAWLDGTTGGRYTDEVTRAVLATPVVADAMERDRKVAEIVKNCRASGYTEPPENVAFARIAALHPE